MDQYLEASGIHGFSYLTRRHPFCARIFWSVIIVTGFSMAGFLIIESLNDWDSNQTITTLDSIATPIQEVQFPTVTVCPHEESPPDNWSYLEKFLNALAFTGDGAITGDLRSDIEGILIKLVLKMEEMFRKFPNSNVWIANANQNTYAYGNVLTQAAKLMCNGEINPNSLRKKIAEGFMKGKSFNEFIDTLDGDYDYIDYYYGDNPYPCDDNCCVDYKQNPEKIFFIAIMNAGHFLFYQQSIGFGTFLANFANLTNAMIGNGDFKWSVFDLEMKFELETFSGDKTVCDKLSDMDEFLNGYFQNLSTAIGFTEDHSFSLFDIPSMFRAELELENLNTKKMLAKEVFLYSQCQKRKIKKDFHPCFFDCWSTFINYDTDGMYSLLLSICMCLSYFKI
jgi:hypothetical protein